MTKYTTALIGCLGIDLGSPDEVLSELVKQNIITDEDMHKLINSNVMQLALVA